MHRFAFGLFALLLAASCRTAGEPPSQASAPTNTGAPVPSAAVAARLSPPTSTVCSPPRQSPSARLILERTACHGFCPDYTIEVRGDGMALYEGRNFVHVRGKHMGRIAQAAVDALFAKAACAQPENWKSDYTYPVTDNPSATVTIDLGDGSPPIVVRDYPPCHEAHEGDDTPAELCDLEKAIDTTLGSDAYVQCPGPDGGVTYCGP